MGTKTEVSRFPLRPLPPRAEVRAVAADSVLLGAACLVSYVLTTRVLSLVYSVSADDDALGGMWAVIATVFLFRDSYDKSLSARRLAAAHSQAGRHHDRCRRRPDRRVARPARHPPSNPAVGVTLTNRQALSSIQNLSPCSSSSSASCSR